MDINLWLVYLLAVIGLSLSPGPNGLLALTHGALHGRRKALFTVFGGAFGFCTVLALSMFGGAAAGWLTILKWVGGAYLVWLGIQLWRSPPISVGVHAPGPSRPGWPLFRQGALAAVSNPKAILFFAAFLPQFIDPARSLPLQFVIMAGTFAIVEITYEIVVASLAHRIRPWLQRVGKRFNQACGGVFMAIGIALPLRSVGAAMTEDVKAEKRGRRSA